MKKILLATMLLSAPLFAEEPATTEQLLSDISHSFTWSKTRSDAISDGSNSISVKRIRNSYYICTPYKDRENSALYLSEFKPYKEDRGFHKLPIRYNNSKGCFKITSINIIEDMSRARSFKIQSTSNIGIEIDLQGFTEAFNQLK